MTSGKYSAVMGSSLLEQISAHRKFYTVLCCNSDGMWESEINQKTSLIRVKSDNATFTELNQTEVVKWQTVVCVPK